MKFKKKVILAILDGWGLGKKDKFNAIDNAKTPNFDQLMRKYPNIQLRADGPFVGLPEGQFGTSEINHQVIGAGRVVLQDLPRIDKAIQDKTFFSNTVFNEMCRYVNEKNSALHLVGIVSDGKVHSSLEHLFALIELAKRNKVQKVFIHAFSDGRDVPPKSVAKYLDILNKYITQYSGVEIASLQGRFWLDRDRDWEKTQKAVDLITKGQGHHVNSYQAAINLAYNQNVTDEFFEQYIINPDGTVKAQDAIIFTHYRTDRLYQIIKGILDCSITGLMCASFIEVSEEFGIPVAFPRSEIKDTLAETLAHHNKKQFHITETEKYRHLTYFFNGGREHEYSDEAWQLIQSNRYVKPFYNLEPTMKAFDITQVVTKHILADDYDFIVINFANTDMVGHTGNYEAAVIAAESVDFCLGKIYEAVRDKMDSYAFIITADHGNSDEMWDYENNQPHTQHTLNPVPLILVSDINCKLHRRESLEDIAPTILELMDVPKPKTMSGESLIQLL